MAFLARATVLLATAALALPPAVLASPWDLRDYDRVCEETRLSRIRSDASGVTYSPVTNTLWVVARKPMGLFEYDIDGDYLRYVEVGNMRFKDPEGAPPCHCPPLRPFPRPQDEMQSPSSDRLRTCDLQPGSLLRMQP